MDTTNKYEHLSSLKVLEVRNNPGNLYLVSYFPSITSYRLVSYFPLHKFRKYNPISGLALRKILDHKYLRCLYLSTGLPREVSCHFNCSSLQQLYIDSRCTVLEEAFIDALSMQSWWIGTCVIVC